MACPPSIFVGKIQITSDNNFIYWLEDDGVGVFVALSAELTVGDYYPEDLMTEIASVMQTESALTGNPHTYAGAFEVSDAIVAIECTNAKDFKLDADPSQPANVWSGHVEDSAGNLLIAGEVGPNHLGFLALTVFLAGLSFSSAIVIGNVFRPSKSIARNIGRQFESEAAQARSIGGTFSTYDYTGHVWNHGDPFPKIVAVNTLGFEMLRSTDREQYIMNFWSPYAKKGLPFRFYGDRSDSTTYREVLLINDALKKSGFSDRMQGYPFFTHSMTVGDVL